jgi:5-methylcytosine-specific restriction endonuclease McrA
MENKDCTVCGRNYPVKRYLFEKSKFCSKECRATTYKYSDVEIICKNCNKPFVRKKHESKLSKKGSYCSPECYESRSPPQMVKCQCGIEFLAYQSRIKYYNKLYCSDECKHKFQLTGSLTALPVERNRYQKFVAQLRHTARYFLWKKACLERDRFVCSSCPNIDGLTVHHKISVMDFVKRHGLNRDKIEADVDFFDPTNGVTLCRSCHFSKHHV